MDPILVAERLRGGAVLLVADRYTTGVRILEVLVGMMPPPDDDSYAARQAHRAAVRAASMRLLAPIAKHRLALAEARPIGFLKELYPELSSFSLPFVQVQELRGAWKRYLEGVHLQVLGHKIHPFYATYVPNRKVHLELFGTWLSQYEGGRTQAIDVGTGCGVLAWMLSKAGFESVLATDINRNAVESVRRELVRHPPAGRVDVRRGDLLGNDAPEADLIVFNPPWTQGTPADGFEQALMFEEGLFGRFFDQSLGRLRPGGRIVLLFSNVMELVQPDVPHPVDAELERGRLRLVRKLRRKVKAGKTAEGRKRRTRERVEVFELAAVEP
jgi:hypothetical protein